LVAENATNTGLSVLLSHLRPPSPPRPARPSPRGCERCFSELHGCGHSSAAGALPSGSEGLRAPDERCSAPSPVPRGPSHGLRYPSTPAGSSSLITNLV